MSGLKLLYPHEPSVFNGKDIENFALWCVEQKTSDITIKTGDKIICDIYGQKIRVTKRTLTKSEVISIINFIYGGDGAIATLNAGQDIRRAWTVRYNREKIIRFRVTYTAIYDAGHTGYELTIRIIENTAPLLKDLNLPSDIINNIYHENGLILVVGATGSGKSTFLASIVGDFLRDEKKSLKILSYENPIEYVHDDIIQNSSFICQTEIPTHLKTFSDGLKNALTRSPDVIIVGEMKDKETVAEGLNASLTGHLVFSTLHADTAPIVIRRLLSYFPLEEKNSRALDILSNLRMIVAQKLVESTDGKRVALREYIVFKEGMVEKLIEKGIDNITSELKKMISQYGKSFLEDAKEKLNQGKISQEKYEELELYYRNK